MSLKVKHRITLEEVADSLVLSTSSLVVPGAQEGNS
jgi:hypothetical protein